MKKNINPFCVVKIGGLYPCESIVFCESIKDFILSTGEVVFCGTESQRQKFPKYTSLMYEPVDFKIYTDEKKISFISFQKELTSFSTSNYKERKYRFRDFIKNFDDALIGNYSSEDFDKFINKFMFLIDGNYYKQDEKTKDDFSKMYEKTFNKKLEIFSEDEAFNNAYIKNSRYSENYYIDGDEDILNKFTGSGFFKEELFEILN